MSHGKPSYGTDWIDKFVDSQAFCSSVAQQKGIRFDLEARMAGIVVQAESGVRALAPDSAKQ